MSVPANHDKAAEPNLTPMLDMVLQLVMFFMLCANFIAEETNAMVKLPNASAARILDKNSGQTIFINLTYPGKDKFGVDQPKTLTFNAGVRKVACSNSLQLQTELENQYKLDEARAQKKPEERAEWEAGRGRSIVILRADQRHDYKEINEILAAARAANYRDIQLRAIQLKN